MRLIRSTTLWGYDELVRELGGDPVDYLTRLGLPPAIRRDDDAFVPFDECVELLEITAAELQCPDFGLRMSRWQGLDILGPTAVIARNAHSVIGGWQAIARYLYAHSPATHLTASSTESGWAMSYRYDLSGPHVVAIQRYELSMAIAVRITHLLGGPGALPTFVAFTHQQQGVDAAYRDALGCPVRFSQTWTGFELARDLAERPIRGADPETSRIATRYLESNYLPPSAKLVDRVANLARRLLPTGQCSVDAIAAALALHPRTLQRRLAAEGTRCQDVIEAERRALVLRYLARPGLQLGQIASLVGYAEQSALNRSCQRWFGKTPGQLRADVAQTN